MIDSMKLKNMRIAVLYGGMSAERDVSLETGKAIGRALSALGYHPVLIDQGRDLAARLQSEKIEVAFIALHGKWGEDGCVQGMLEILGIPYTGSKVLASALAMDKAISKAAFAQAGLPVAPHVVLSEKEIHDVSYPDPAFGFPLVVKPVAEGSSVGASIVHNKKDIVAALEDALRTDSRVMVEKFVEGREVSVSVLCGDALGVIEIVPKEAFYDYKAKYASDNTEYIYPARITPEQYDRCMKIGEQAHEAIGCAGATRTDIIIDDKGNLTVLEINTMPGMTSHSLVPKTAAGVGMSFEVLCERILSDASLGLHYSGEDD